MLDAGFLQPEVPFYLIEMLTLTGVKARLVFSLELGSDMNESHLLA